MSKSIPRGLGGSDEEFGAGPDLARLAHELRTPLSAVAALAEMMRDERLGPLGGDRYRSYAADIHESAAHVLVVIAGYLDPGERRGASGLPMAFVELDLGEVVAAAVSALGPLAERAGVRLSVAVPAGLPRLIADRRSLRQILDNLVGNALKYTPPCGSVAVAVAYEQGGQVELSVTDTGDGMSEAELARARAGASAPEPIRRRSGGTGFGLPLVRALAAASGASVAIESALGRGTRICVAFPHERLVIV